jgi:hypothetical protein
LVYQTNGTSRLPLTGSYCGKPFSEGHLTISLEGTGNSDTAEKLKRSRAVVRLIYQSLMLLNANSPNT